MLVRNASFGARCIMKYRPLLTPTIAVPVKCSMIPMMTRDDIPAAADIILLVASRVVYAISVTISYLENGGVL